MRVRQISFLLFVLTLLPISLQAQNLKPRITAVTDLPSYVEGPVSPGQMIILWGFGLGPAKLEGLQLDSSGRLTSNLSGVQVMFDGVPAPLVYVSQNQTAAVVPRSVIGKAWTDITVVRAGFTSDSFRCTVASTSVGVFTADASGKGVTAALNADGSYHDAAHPADPGSWITLFVTGAGDTSPPGLDGVISDSATPIAAPVSAQIGYREATVLYAGSAPGNVFGFSQFNVVVPSGLPHGGAYPLTLRVGDSASQSGVIVYVKGSATPPPNAPGSLSAVPQGLDKVQLSWRASDGLAYRFRIERRRLDSPYTEVAIASEPTFLDANVQGGSEYFYRVRAEGASGVSDYSAEVRVKAGKRATDIPLVISQVYVNALYGTRLYRQDYAEIFNVGTATEDLRGLSLQTASNHSTDRWKSTPLSGTLQPGDHYLVAIKSGAPGGPVLQPTPDATGPGIMGSSVVLVQGVEPILTEWPADDETIDLFGYGEYGRLDTVYQGRPFAEPSTGSMAFFRKDGGCQDTEDNATDFYLAAPEPRNKLSPATPCATTVVAPWISSVGVRNAATLREGPLAPGTLAVVEGGRFVPGRTEVVFGTVNGSVYAVTSDRLLVGVPQELAGKTAATMTVRADGRDSVPFLVKLAKTAPGIFSRASAQLDALPPLNEGGGRNGPEASASGGSIVTLSVTGLGFPTQSLTVMVGGRTADVLDLHPAASRLSELHELAVRVPDGLEGVQAVTVQSGGVASPPVYLNLHAPMTRYDDFDVLRMDSLDIAYDPFRDAIYAATTSGSSGLINVIDPHTRSVVESLACGPSPNHLALSANGRYLWLSTMEAGESSIQRIDLEKREVEFSVTLDELLADQSELQQYVGVTALRAHPQEEELLVALINKQAYSRPLIVLDGPQRMPGLGPPAGDALFLEDGTLWTASALLVRTDSHLLEIGRSGIKLLRTAPEEDVGSLGLVLGNRVLDYQHAFREAEELRRTGFIGFGAAGGVGMAYRPEDGRLYVGGGFGGVANYGIQAFDPLRMIPVGHFIFYYHLVGDRRPWGGPRRFVSIGSEGFATTFDSKDENRPGGVLFFPLSLIAEYAEPALPDSQPRTDAVRYFPFPVGAAAIDPVTGKVFFSLPSANGSIGNSVLPFDPDTGVFGEPVWVGSEPFVGTVTPDGWYLYLYMAGSRTVKRFRLPTLEPDLEFSVLDDSGQPVTATALMNVPNAPSTTVAVQRHFVHDVLAFAGVAVYDDGVKRPKTTAICYECEPPGRNTSSTQFAPSSSQLFAIDNWVSSFTFTRWHLTPEGFVADAAQTSLSAGHKARLRCTDSYCITSSGLLFDPHRMERIRMFGDSLLDDATGSFNDATLIALDSDRDRVFFLESGRLMSYQVSTGTLKGVVDGSFVGDDMQLLTSGDLMLLGSAGIFLVPNNLLP